MARRRLRLRPWQRKALDVLAANDGRDFLAVATPGAGKTTFAVTAAIQDLGDHPHRRLLVVAPTRHLKTQWADAAARLGLHLEPDWSADGGLPPDMHGAVATYQQVAAQAEALHRLADDAFVVLDEIHHAGTDRTWGDAVAHAFARAAVRLSLSGTPFRSDDNPIPFVDYEHGVARPDYSYGYGDALADGGVVRPVFFPRIDGHMEWTAPDGTLREATFTDPLDAAGASQRLRTALSPDGEWLPEVLDQGHAVLARLRESHPRAAGLVVAMDVDHAHAVARLLGERTGTDPVVATSDDPGASDRIAAFATGSAPWIVAVRMVSEGVDIPRLRVGVYATNVVTELFFRQAVGRLVRWTPGMRRQKAFFLIPDEPRLRTFAARLGQERTHSLARREEEGEQPPVALDAVRDEDDQLSLFQAISATPLGDRPDPSVLDDDHPEDLIHEDGDDAGVEIELRPPPRPGGGDPGAQGGVAVSRARRKQELRRQATDRVQLLVHLTGADHRAINGRLNDEVGIRSVEAATLHELEQRLRLVDRWLAEA